MLLKKHQEEIFHIRLRARRPGDIGVCYADPTKAKVELGWIAERGIEEMCEDSWRWQFNNPNGYEEKSDQLIGTILIKLDLHKLLLFLSIELRGLDI